MPQTKPSHGLTAWSPMTCRATYATRPHTRARALEMLGHIEGAVEELEPLWDRCLTGDTHLPLPELSVLLTHCLLEGGDLLRATDVAERGLARCWGIGIDGTSSVARLTATLIWVYVERGDLLHASRLVSEALQQYPPGQDPASSGPIYWNAALVQEGLGNVAVALGLCDKALALLSEAGKLRDVPRLRLLRGWLLLRADPARPEDALRELDIADTELQIQQAWIDVAYCETERSRAFLLLGDASAAVTAAKSALKLLGNQPRLESARARVALGDAYAACGRRKDAITQWERAATTLSTMSASRQAAMVWRQVGDRLVAHDPDASIRAYRAALDALAVRGLAPAPIGATQG